MSPPAAVGDPSPAWPLPGRESLINLSRSFGAPRGPNKLHAGIDLVAPEGWPVVAMEAGRVTRVVRGWDNVYKNGALFRGNTARLIVQGDSGLVLLYAAIGIDSWEEFAVDAGSRVAKGQPIGRVGTYPGGGQMLHLEAYTEGTRDNQKWLTDKPTPPELLDPTDYVSAAVAGKKLAPPVPRPPRPSPRPSPQPVAAGGGGIAVLALVALAAVGFGR